MKKEQKKAWWRESRFGMFIHWGVYSRMGQGEWVMYNQRIPVKEYEKLAQEFNPVRYDADEWVRIAKEAGMKYIVITAKHHDGFSMFRTKADSFNIVDGTPYGKDVMTELARACEREGLKLCFYYSHVREWRHPHAQSLEAIDPNLFGNYGNFWDYPDEQRKNLQIYLDEFDKPQLRELLTQYGPVGILWFDTPSMIRPDQAKELVDLVRELQPDCLINSRVSDDDSVDYDYLSLGDCEIPGIPVGTDWETPMTICTWWGYYTGEGNEYRSPRELVRQLVDIASLGGNYLLNVGPNGEGEIPDEAQQRLREVGRWMNVNGEAVYGTEGSPFATRPQWGRITVKGEKLYLHVYEWQNTIYLYGLRNRVNRCYLLSDPNCSIAYRQSSTPAREFERMAIELPRVSPDPYCTLVVLELEGAPDVDQAIIQDESREIVLPANKAAIHREAEGSRIKLARTGGIQNWFCSEDWLSWEYIVTQPGEYEASLLVGTGPKYRKWDYGHEVEVTIQGQRLACLVEEDEALANEPLTIRAGRIRLDRTGQCDAQVRASLINRKNMKGLLFWSLQLKPVDGGQQAEI